MTQQKLDGEDFETDTKNSRVFIEAHGCSASYADAEILGGFVTQGGYRLVESESEADLSILVTCSVKEVTEHRMMSRIRQLSRDRKLIVAGCLPKAEPNKVLGIDPGLTMIGPGNLDKIIPAIESSLRGRQFVALEQSKFVKLGLPRTRKNSVIGIVEIASGCLSSCTFCQVKLVKGTVFSYPERDIVEEVRSLVSQGAKEIWLTSTDNSAYGKDSKTTLYRLIDSVCKIEGDFKVRIGMMNPLLTGRMLEDLIRAFRNEKVFKFLHLPVQSGSDRVLKVMQRGYDVEDYYSTVESFRREFPDLTLSTDIIAGFPSETDEDFEDSLDLVRRSKPDIVNISRYGARAGTAAAGMENQISSGEAKRRSSRMHETTKQVSLDNNRKWLGWKGEILLDELGKDAIIGRNPSYKPCVLKLDQVADKNPEKLLGRVVSVSVFGATSSTLRVLPCENNPVVDLETKLC
jgi:threonylcarbamoyladenosine tRNA methylthiotransferase CDKAL1